MNEIINVKGVPCYEENGVAYLNLEAVARGLGFTQTQTKNGTEYTSVRWETIRKYLGELGFEVFPNLLGKDGLPDFIPENIFYRLAMKAKNETAEKFQTLIADVVIPQIRKTGSYNGEKNIGEVVKLIESTRTTMKEAGANPNSILKVVKGICEQFGIHLPNCFVKDECASKPELMSMVDFIYSHPSEQKPSYSDWLAHVALQKHLDNGGTTLVLSDEREETVIFRRRKLKK